MAHNMAIVDDERKFIYGPRVLTNQSPLSTFFVILFFSANLFLRNLKNFAKSNLDISFNKSDKNLSVFTEIKFQLV